VGRKERGSVKTDTWYGEGIHGPAAEQGKIQKIDGPERMLVDAHKGTKIRYGRRGIAGTQRLMETLTHMGKRELG